MHEQIKTRIESIINNIDQLPSIPDVATRIINLVNDPDVSFKKVADEIMKDQSMTTNILKLSNSAYFSKGKEITSIDRAIVTLGLKEVKDIVIVLVTKPILDKAIIGYDLAKGDLWKQGLLVGTLSKKIAMKKMRKDIADVVFTGGLIHNVGKLVLALFIQSTFKDILNEVKTKNISFNEAEKVIMGYNHQEIGEKILLKWKFPPVLRSIVRFYSEPNNAPNEHKHEVAIVHIANSLCLMAGIGIGSDGLYHMVDGNALKQLNINEAELEDYFSKIPEMLKEIMDLS
jgi:HD-like signal output (HDOD) protein